MAPVKRKGNDRDESSAHSQKKRVKTDEKTKAQKHGKPKPKPDDASKPQENKQNAGSDSAAKPEVVSVLRDEAPAFPRGGAHVLTPLERKQIQIDATRDVLFEQKGGEKEAEASDYDEEEGSKKTVKSAAKTKRNKKDKTQPVVEEKDGVRVEGLNFKVHSRFLRYRHG